MMKVERAEDTREDRACGRTRVMYGRGRKHAEKGRARRKTRVRSAGVEEDTRRYARIKTQYRVHTGARTSGSCLRLMARDVLIYV